MGVTIKCWEEYNKWSGEILIIKTLIGFVYISLILFDNVLWVVVS
ncbi:Uncharacterised protein [Yersinia aleksiciae]|uniref:Uncharacterized protein n=1 Tax=Yersinia aleksiciae TaxID=263819 RepID=A0A0T9TMI9_YERAE|nr:Uncharacterised protein [Yersinia aleksiciae]